MAPKRSTEVAVEPPAKAARIEVPVKAGAKDNKAPKCMKGHGLVTFTTEEKGYGCDRCLESFPANTEMYQCRKCNYDLCASCANPELAKKAGARTSKVIQVKLALDEVRWAKGKPPVEVYKEPKPGSEVIGKLPSMAFVKRSEVHVHEGENGEENVIYIRISYPEKEIEGWIGREHVFTSVEDEEEDNDAEDEEEEEEAKDEAEDPEDQDEEDADEDGLG